MITFFTNFFRHLQRGFESVQPLSTQAIQPSPEALQDWHGNPVINNKKLLAKASIMWQEQNGRCLCCKKKLQGGGVCMPIIEQWFPKSNAPLVLLCENKICKTKLSQAMHKKQVQAIKQQTILLQTILQYLKIRNVHVKDFKTLDRARRINLMKCESFLYCAIYCLYPCNTTKDLQELLEIMKNHGASRRSAARIRSLLRLAQKQNGCCVWCNRPMNFSRIIRRPRQATIEHLIPKFQGGANNQKNFLLACNECNNQRGNTPLALWIKDCQGRGLNVQKSLIIKKLKEMHESKGEFSKTFQIAIDGEYKNLVTV